MGNCVASKIGISSTDCSALKALDMNLLEMRKLHAYFDNSSVDDKISLEVLLFLVEAQPNRVLYKIFSPGLAVDKNRDLDFHDVSL